MDDRMSENVHDIGTPRELWKNGESHKRRENLE